MSPHALAVFLSAPWLLGVAPRPASPPPHVRVTSAAEPSPTDEELLTPERKPSSEAPKPPPPDTRQAASKTKVAPSSALAKEWTQVSRLYRKLRSNPGCDDKKMKLACAKYEGMKDEVADAIAGSLNDRTLVLRMKDLHEELSAVEARLNP
jgi:hypothetical protein